MAKAGSVKDKSWGELGGNNKMHSWSGTGTQEADRTSQEGSGSKRGIAPKAGPSNVMGFRDHSKSGREMSDKPSANQFGAGPAEAGQSASSGARQDGFAKGGTTSMWGNRGSQRAEGGCSGPGPR